MRDSATPIRRRSESRFPSACGWPNTSRSGKVPLSRRATSSRGRERSSALRAHWPRRSRAPLFSISAGACRESGRRAVPVAVAEAAGESPQEAARW